MYQLVNISCSVVIMFVVLYEFIGFSRLVYSRNL